MTQREYDIQCCSFFDYKAFILPEKIDLIIVDTTCYDCCIIKTVKSFFSVLLCRSSSKVPPIIALVDTTLKDKQEIYRFGALDYLGSPIINEELLYRVAQAIYTTENKNVNRNSYEENFDIESESINGAIFDVIHKNQSICSEYILAEKAAEYLKSQLASEHNLDELARKMATNRNKLSRAFKACYGVTVFNWIREQRMLHAAKLLITTTQTISDIADQVGYPDANNFSTAFKRIYRVSPLQYRKVHQAKKVVQESKANTELV